MMTSDELTKKLIAHGADAEATMERFMDDAALYEKCLELFLNDSAFDTLRSALEAGDLKAAFESAHSLKGVAGNLGLTPIYTAICDVVEDLRAERLDGLNVKYSKIMELRETIIEDFC